jgi:hypothetical protein
MKSTVRYIAPWLAAAAMGGALALVPIANADTNPAVPYGTNPTSPDIFGYHTANDIANPTNSTVDVPF